VPAVTPVPKPIANAFSALFREQRGHDREQRGRREIAPEFPSDFPLIRMLREKPGSPGSPESSTATEVLGSSSEKE
jgi:hypothetical protein